MKRFWPYILIAAGFLLIISGFIYDIFFAGIPYQDPTPEMSANYFWHAHIASTIRWCGVGVFLFGAVGGVGCWIVRRSQPSTHESSLEIPQ